MVIWESDFRPALGTGKGNKRKGAGAAGIVLLSREAGPEMLNRARHDTAAKIPKADGKPDRKIREC